MPLRDRIVWVGRTTFSDPRLADLPGLIQDFRRGNYRGWRTQIFENRMGDLPPRPEKYYREHYVGTPQMSGSLRIVLGGNGEVYVTGNHYDDFRQVIGLPGS